MRCPNCKTNDARIDPIYGVLPCNSCAGRMAGLTGPSGQIEFTSEDIKTQRKEFAEDIIQPYRKGELSKEYIKKWGTKRLPGVTKEEIKNAKNVWTQDLKYYKE